MCSKQDDDPFGRFELERPPLTDEQVNDPLYFLPLGEAKTEKAKLEREIKALLDGFTLRTGLHPTRIDLEVVECRPLNRGVLSMAGEVTVEVKL